MARAVEETRKRLQAVSYHGNTGHTALVMVGWGGMYTDRSHRNCNFLTNNSGNRLETLLVGAISEAVLVSYR